MLKRANQTQASDSDFVVIDREEAIEDQIEHWILLGNAHCLGKHKDNIDSKPDYEQAANYYEKAAREGYVDAMITLSTLIGQGKARCCEHGKPDFQQAIDWLETAKANGSKRAEDMFLEIREQLLKNSEKRQCAQIEEWLCFTEEEQARLPWGLLENVREFIQMSCVVTEEEDQILEVKLGKQDFKGVVQHAALKEKLLELDMPSSPRKMRPTLMQAFWQSCTKEYEAAVEIQQTERRNAVFKDLLDSYQSESFNITTDRLKLLPSYYQKAIAMIQKSTSDVLSGNLDNYKKIATKAESYNEANNIVPRKALYELMLKYKTFLVNMNASEKAVKAFKPESIQKITDEVVADFRALVETRSALFKELKTLEHEMSTLLDKINVRLDKEARNLKNPRQKSDPNMLTGFAKMRGLEQKLKDELNSEAVQLVAPNKPLRVATQ